MCWFGETAVCIYQNIDGVSLSCVKSPDLINWNTLPPIAAAGPYAQVSSASRDGTIYAAAADSTQNHLWASGDAGQTWTELTPPPMTDPQAGIGVWPENARLYWGVDYHSDDGGNTWVAN
jgi:hypothetical protein